MRKALGAAALGCGIFFSAATAAADAPPEAGPVPAATVQRLLLLDARVVGRKIVAVGDHGYIVLSDDGGKSWRRARAPAAPLLTGVDFSGEHGLAVGHDATILASDDGGETWTQRQSDPKAAGPLLDVAFLDKDHAIAVGSYGEYYESSDGGKTWASRKIISEDKHFNAIVPMGEGRLMILGEAGTILLSTNSGKDWSTLASPYNGSFFGAQVAADGAVVAFGMRGHIYRTRDQGKSWQPVENASVFSLIGSERLANGAIVLAGAGGTALVSRDNGATFQPIVTRTTRMLAKPLPGDDSSVLLLGEAGARTAPLAAKP